MKSRENTSLALRQIKLFAAKHGVWVGLLFLIILFSFIARNFATFANARVIALQVAELGVIAIPLALLVMTGSIDLSIGSIAALSGIVGGFVLLSTQSPFLAIAAALAVGAVTGAINGILVSALHLNAIVVTLGTLSVWGGFALYLTNGSTLFGFPDSFNQIGTAAPLGIPIQFYFLVGSIVLAWWILMVRPFGRKLVAVGGNERAAFLMGVRVGPTRFIVFVYVGLAAALAGVLLMAKLQAATPTLGVGMELSVLTVVLLGGVQFSGGGGRISGVVAGLLFVGVLKNGLVITGTSQYLQEVFVGATLVASIAISDTMQRLIRKR